MGKFARNLNLGNRVRPPLNSDTLNSDRAVRSTGCCQKQGFVLVLLYEKGPEKGGSLVS